MSLRLSAVRFSRMVLSKIWLPLFSVFVVDEVAHANLYINTASILMQCLMMLILTFAGSTPCTNAGIFLFCHRFNSSSCNRYNRSRERASWRAQHCNRSSSSAITAEGDLFRFIDCWAYWFFCYCWLGPGLLLLLLLLDLLKWLLEDARAILKSSWVPITNSALLPYASRTCSWKSLQNLEWRNHRYGS